MLVVTSNNGKLIIQLEWPNIQISTYKPRMYAPPYILKTAVAAPRSCTNPNEMAGGDAGRLPYSSARLCNCRITL